MEQGLISINIFNFAANIGRELRSFFGTMYTNRPYYGFDLEYIGIKYCKDILDLKYDMDRQTRSTRGKTWQLYETYNGVFKL